MVLLKSSKKAPNKPPKHGTALVPFKKIGDAFAAVCASGRPERGLSGIEVGWVGGKEPQILGWLKKMGQLGAPVLPSSTASISQKVDAPQSKTSSSASAFSSFPDTFVSTINIPSLRRH